MKRRFWPTYTAHSRQVGGGFYFVFILSGVTCLAFLDVSYDTLGMESGDENCTLNPSSYGHHKNIIMMFLLICLSLFIYETDVNVASIVFL